jgi:hypothetical protein
MERGCELPTEKGLMVVGLKDPTHRPVKGACDVLDIRVTQNIYVPVTINTLFELSSCQYSILIEVGDKAGLEY